jgi:hypothetical protein
MFVIVGISARISAAIRHHDLGHRLVHAMDHERGQQSRDRPEECAHAHHPDERDAS